MYTESVRWKGISSRWYLYQCYWNRTTTVKIIVVGWVVSFFETHMNSDIICETLNLMLQLGGILPPIRTFYPVAVKLLRIVTMAFVTFPEYMWAKKCWKKIQISPLVFPIWRLENGHRTKKARKSYINRLFGF